LKCTFLAIQHHNHELVCRAPLCISVHCWCPQHSTLAVRGQSRIASEHCKSQQADLGHLQAARCDRCLVSTTKGADPVTVVTRRASHVVVLASVRPSEVRLQPPTQGSISVPLRMTPRTDAVIDLMGWWKEEVESNYAALHGDTVAWSECIGNRVAACARHPSQLHAHASGGNDSDGLHQNLTVAMRMRPQSLVGYCRARRRCADQGTA
jgi:hypothetical protein